MRAVRRAERVVDVQVGVGGQLGGKGRVVLLLLLVEADVVEQEDLFLVCFVAIGVLFDVMIEGFVVVLVSCGVGVLCGGCRGERASDGREQ